MCVRQWVSLSVTQSSFNSAAGLFSHAYREHRGREELCNQERLVLHGRRVQQLCNFLQLGLVFGLAVDVAGWKEHLEV